MYRSIWGLTLCLLSLQLTAHADDWNAFRGPAGDGISAETRLPTTWGPEQNIKWKVPLPRPSNGSPIVSAGRVFVTCAEDAQGLKRSLYCFDRRDGKRLWVRTVDFDKEMPTHRDNPYCGSTPAADGKRVVVWHASAGLYCYDMEGKRLWQRDLGEFHHIWGYGSSPVIYRDRVILNCSPGKRNFVTAVDLATGKTLWEQDEPHQGDGSRNEFNKYMGSWTTPLITRVDGKDQVVCSMPTRVVGYDPDSGAIVWFCEGLRGERGDLAYSAPLVLDGFCVATGGFRGPSVGFKLGGQGNITEAYRMWREEQNPQNIGSGVFLDGYIYKANAGPGTLQCLEARSGRVVWEKRAGGGGNYWGSIVFGGGNLYVTNQAGTTHVFKPNSTDLELVASNELGESSNSTPALSDGEIFIHTFEHLYCIAE